MQITHMTTLKASGAYGNVVGACGSSRLPSGATLNQLIAEIQLRTQVVVHISTRRLQRPIIGAVLLSCVDLGRLRDSIFAPLGLLLMSLKDLGITHGTILVRTLEATLAHFRNQTLSGTLFECFSRFSLALLLHTFQTWRMKSKYFKNRSRRAAVSAPVGQQL